MAPVLNAFDREAALGGADGHEVSGVYYTSRTDRSVEFTVLHSHAMLSGRLARGATWMGAALAMAVANLAFAADPKTESTPEVVAIRGRVVCLDTLPESPGVAESDPCNQPGARFELRAASGEAIPFVAGDPRADLFTDPQVRDLDLEVRGWRRVGAMEVLSVHAVRNGTLHHLHYRCDVCNITTYAPGPCWCCGQPFELREGPSGGAPPPEGQ
jgi:hypothetical protein